MRTNYEVDKEDRRYRSKDEGLSDKESVDYEPNRYPEEMRGDIATSSYVNSILEDIIIGNDDSDMTSDILEAVKRQGNPMYAVDEGDKMSRILDRWEKEEVKGFRGKSQIWTGLYLPNSSNDNKSESARIDELVQLYEENRKKHVVHMSDSPAGATATAGGDNSAKEIKRVGNTEAQSQPEEVSGWRDGVKSSLDKARLSWDYLGKKIQAQLTPDGEKKEALQQEAEKIASEHESLPSLKGAASISSVAADIVGSALPVAIAGAVASPGVALAVGGGAMLAGMGQTIANANMEMDNYEKQTGEKIPAKNRLAYVTTNVATDVIMDVVFNSSLLKGASKSVTDQVRKDLKGAIFNNSVAQKEFNAMTQQVLKNERENLRKQAVGNITEGAVQGAVGGLSQESSKSFYTQEAPELEKIVNSVVGGAMAGMAMGATSTALQPAFKHNDRMSRDEIDYGSSMKDATKQQIPIQEVRPVEVIPDEKKPLKKPQVEVEHGLEYGGATQRSIIESPNIVSGSYRQAVADGATSTSKDAWDFSNEQLDELGKKWNNAVGLMEDDKEEAYARQNEVIQGIAGQMGVPVRVYASPDDVPDQYKGNEVVNNSSAVTVGNDEIWFILDNCKDLKIDQVVSTIRHESVGHYGMPKNYPTTAEYNKVLTEIGQQEADGIATMRLKPGTPLENAEEYASRQAEKREYNKLPSSGEGRTLLDEVLSQSEQRLRNTTTGELRESFFNTLRSHYDMGDNPMPSLKEIEQNKRHRTPDRVPYRPAR